MYTKIHNKVALITGGVGGIGLQCTRTFLKNGLKGVTIVDINENGGRKTIKDLSEEFNANLVLFVKANVANKDELKAAFQKTIEKFKQLDIVINNAGTANEINWEHVVETNCNGVINGTLLALEEYLPKFKSGSEGIIVNVASVAGLNPESIVPIYSGTKSLVVSFSRAISETDATVKNKMRILILCPGLTVTAILDKIEGLREKMRHLKEQSPQHVAEELVKIIENGPNGSAWIVQSGEDAESVKF